MGKIGKKMQQKKNWMKFDDRNFFDEIYSEHWKNWEKNSNFHDSNVLQKKVWIFHSLFLLPNHIEHDSFSIDLKLNLELCWEMKKFIHQWNSTASTGTLVSLCSSALSIPSNNSTTGPNFRFFLHSLSAISFLMRFFGFCGLMGLPGFADVNF